MDPWRIAQNTGAPYAVTLNDTNGNPVPYTGTEGLLFSVWAGNDLSPLWTSVPQWNTPAAGVVSVTVTGAQTAGMAVGFYRGIVTVTDAGGTHDGAEVLLEIVASPGVALVRPTYITARDLRNVAAWIDNLQSTEFGEAGFLDQCADSRDWLDESMLRQYRGGNISLLGYHGLALDAWYTGGVRRTSLTNIWLKQQLAANALIVTPKVKKVCAYYALYLICDSLINSGQQYQALAAKYRRQANQTLASTVCELNLNGDGVTPHLPINFSSTNTLFG